MNDIDGQLNEIISNIGINSPKINRWNDAIVRNAKAQILEVIANEYEFLRDRSGRNLRFYLLPSSRHQKGDDGSK